MSDDRMDPKDNKKSSNINYEQTARLRVIKNEEIEEYKKNKIEDLDNEDYVKTEKVKRFDFENKIFRKPLKTSSKYKQKYIILWVVVFLVFVLAYQFVKVKDVDFNKLTKNIELKLNMADFSKGDDRSLRKNYSINKTDIEGYTYFAPKSNMMANEILVIKCKPEYASDIMKRIQKRIDSQSTSFQNYAPDQYKIIKGSELKQKGNYIYFISWPKIDDINDIISESYK